MKKQIIKTEYRLLCKKDYLRCYVVLFHKNEYYTVRENKSHGIYCICDDQFFEHLFTHSDVIEYFYTKQEVRKIKLNKIYEESES